jgi:drug/metabolite transporter (DMT)-like permease
MPLSLIVIGLAFASAVLHAAWNAILRSGEDRLQFIAIMYFATGIAALPFAIWLGLPAIASLPYLLISACLEVGYGITLAAAYKSGSLNQVYPIARGGALVIITALGVVLAHDPISFSAIAGAVLITVGTLGSTGCGEPRSRRAVTLALLTAAFVASYTMTDARGSRLAGNAFAYTAWLFILTAALMAGVFRLMRRDGKNRVRIEQVRHAMGAGALAFLSYALLMMAYTNGPVGPVAAVRETSALFAMAIGFLCLKEPLSKRRVVAGCIIATGAVVLAARL